LKASILFNVVNAVDCDNSSDLWHKRLSHISEKGLNCLVKKNLLSGLKEAKLENYAHCFAGKQHKVSFKSHPPSRKSELLELVHSDLCGPMRTKTFGGGLYFVTLIDDYSRKLWVYVLKTKDQVLGVFKQFQASVERDTGKKLKCVHIDNGGEYCGPFDEYCRQQGIRHQKTPFKTPQLNGLAERMNKTLMERVRCLLSEAKLLGSFWGEALYTATHVINLPPVVVLKVDVSNRVWYGKDVSYNHFRVFGCKTFVHVPKDERSKLDAKTIECIFIGYGHDEFGYRFYDHVEKKLVRSRDVIFVEDQTIEDIGKTEKSESLRFYEHVKKKLVRSRDVIFVEDQTIEDIGKTEKSESLSTDDVVDFDPTPQTDKHNVANFDCHDDDVQDHIANDSVDDNDDIVGDFG